MTQKGDLRNDARIVLRMTTATSCPATDYELLGTIKEVIATGAIAV